MIADNYSYKNIHIDHVNSKKCFLIVTFLGNVVHILEHIKFTIILVEPETRKRSLNVIKTKPFLFRNKLEQPTYFKQPQLHSNYLIKGINIHFPEKVYVVRLDIYFPIIK